MYSHFGDLPVSAIDTAHILAALNPIWATKNETASRVRGRIEVILDAEAAKKTRYGENPARWKGHMQVLLPQRKKVSTVTHHAALPYADLPGFVGVLQQRSGMGARALEFTILTAARSAMTFLATWGEIDFDTATWNIPGERMKGRRPFRVPLSQEAMVLLRMMQPLRKSEDPDCFIFPGDSQGHISSATMANVLDGIVPGMTVHGFRSTCRDWIADCTEFSNEVAEMVLAHAVGNDVEAAYRRGEMFDKRRKVMDAWGAYYSGKKGSSLSLAA